MLNLRFYVKKNSFFYATTMAFVKNWLPEITSFPYIYIDVHEIKFIRARGGGQKKLSFKIIFQSMYFWEVN